MKNKLFLIPTVLSDNSLDNVIPPMVYELINNIDIYIVENLRSARRFLKKLNIKKKIDQLDFFILNKHTSNIDLEIFLEKIKGKDFALMSEAGCPAVADPGANLIRISHKKNIKIVPIVGPSSILLSLMASGMNGQNFAFVGYLPIKKNERIKKIKFLEKRAKNENQTQIFIETPYRNLKMLEDLFSACNPETEICIASNITSKDEFIKTKKIKYWKKNIPSIHKIPTIFLMRNE